MCQIFFDRVNKKFFTNLLKNPNLHTVKKHLTYEICQTKFVFIYVELNILVDDNLYVISLQKLKPARFLTHTHTCSIYPQLIHPIV